MGIRIIPAYPRQSTFEKRKAQEIKAERIGSQRGQEPKKVNEGAVEKEPFEVDLNPGKCNEEKIHM